MVSIIPSTTRGLIISTPSVTRSIVIGSSIIIIIASIVYLLQNEFTENSDSTQYITPTPYNTPVVSDAKPVPTYTPAVTPTSTSTPVPTVSATQTPTPTLVPTATSTPIPTPTATTVIQPTVAPTATPVVVVAAPQPTPTQQANADSRHICDTHYTTQQAREDCWWRYHNDLPLIEEQPKATKTPAPNNIFYCLSLAEIDYVNLLLDHIKTTSDHVEATGNIIYAATQNEDLLVDSEWIGHKNTMLDALSNDLWHYAFIAIDSTHKFNDIDNHLSDTMAEVYAASLAFQVAFTQEDNDMFSIGFESLIKSDEMLNAALVILSNVCP